MKVKRLAFGPFALAALSAVPGASVRASDGSRLRDRIVSEAREICGLGVVVTTYNSFEIRDPNDETAFRRQWDEFLKACRQADFRAKLARLGISTLHLNLGDDPRPNSKSPTAGLTVSAQGAAFTMDAQGRPGGRLIPSVPGTGSLELVFLRQQILDAERISAGIELHQPEAVAALRDALPIRSPAGELRGEPLVDH
jgi:hypothetical protein